MTDENAAILRAVMDAAAREDWDAALAHYDPDVEVDTTRSLPDGRAYHGLDGLRRSWIEWRGTWEAYDFEVEDVVASGDRVVMLLHIRGRGRGQRSRRQAALGRDMDLPRPQGRSVAAARRRGRGTARGRNRPALALPEAVVGTLGKWSGVPPWLSPPRSPAWVDSQSPGP
jgi:ketosteroid isomerase-like protein